MDKENLPDIQENTHQIRQSIFIGLAFIAVGLALMVGLMLMAIELLWLMGAIG